MMPVRIALHPDRLPFSFLIHLPAKLERRFDLSFCGCPCDGALAPFRGLGRSRQIRKIIYERKVRHATQK